jgi:hypothetical protein
MSMYLTEYDLDDVIRHVDNRCAPWMLHLCERRCSRLCVSRRKPSPVLEPSCCTEPATHEAAQTNTGYGRPYQSTGARC